MFPFKIDTKDSTNPLPYTIQDGTLPKHVLGIMYFASTVDTFRVIFFFPPQKIWLCWENVIYHFKVKLCEFNFKLKLKLIYIYKAPINFTCKMFWPFPYCLCLFGFVLYKFVIEPLDRFSVSIFFSSCRQNIIIWKSYEFIRL